MSDPGDLAAASDTLDRLRAEYVEVAARARLQGGADPAMRAALARIEDAIVLALAVLDSVRATAGQPGRRR